MRTPIRSIRLMTLFVTALLLCTLGVDVHAWGAKGHRIAGHMAHDLLTPETRAAVQQLMGSDQLATFSLYLDQRKDQLDRDIPGSRQWHYDDVPICATTPYAEYCPQGTCASTQIVQHDRLLSDVHASKGKKQFAVFVLTHLVEDIHQPLHGADNEDQGGNQIKVKLPDGRKVNLHTVWDTSLLERLYGGQNEMSVAKRLVQKYASRATEWQTGTMNLVTIQAWVAESTRLAQEVAYGQLPGFACGADLEQTRIALSNDYLQPAEPMAEEQLAKAG
jgi:nuclease S1